MGPADRIGNRRLNNSMSRTVEIGQKNIAQILLLTQNSKNKGKWDIVATKMRHL